MKLISHIFSGYNCNVSFVVNPRTANQKADKEEPLLQKYTSRVGSQSLIFNPSIYIQIQGRKSENSRNVPYVSIPINMIRRFSAAVSSVYSSMQTTKKLYYQDNGILYTDKKLAAEVAKKVSVFSSMVSIIPSVCTLSEHRMAQAADLISNGNLITSIFHGEMLELIELLEHFDSTTYALLTALVDEVESMHNKMDLTLNKLDNIERMLLGLTGPVQPKKQESFNWEVVG